MKSSISFILTVAVLLFGVLACDIVIEGNGARETVRGSGTLVEEERSVSGLSGVELTMQGTLYITTGSSESLRIEAEDNLLEYIQTNVRGGKLVIGTRQGINLRASRPIKYYLTVDELNSITITSSGDVEAGDLQATSFSATISSSGNLSISSLEGTKLEVTISSSGNVDISGGQVRTQNVTLTSSGQYRAKELASAEADVTLTSSGEATIRVSDHLSGRLSSSGNVRYIGDPRLDVRTTSSGRAIQSND